MAKAVAGAVALAWALAQAVTVAPTNDLPNTYQTIENLFKMPAGRTWGSTSAVGVDKDGKSIWVGERCGANTCLGSNLDPILKFDAKGKLLKAFGAGTMIFPHGLYVDAEGNVWVTDGQDNRPRRARGAPPNSPLPPDPPVIVGHQVYKYSPDGKLLMTLGKKGGGRDADYFYQPNAVFVAPNGAIFVSEGHSSTEGSTGRVLKFDKDGKFLRSWGRFGKDTGEFDQPHALAMDSKGRLFVADRGNNRIQIFDQDGNYLDQWTQFSRISGLFIDRANGDTLYAADSESGSVNAAHGAWTRGIRIGSAKDGSVKWLIPDSWPTCAEGQRPAADAPCANNTSSAEGIAVDRAGNIYGAEVGQKAIKKYVKIKQARR